MLALGCVKRAQLWSRLVIAKAMSVFVHLRQLVLVEVDTQLCGLRWESWPDGSVDHPGSLVGDG
eukprot:675123-Pleurochrysis_carterae.AAC.1